MNANLQIIPPDPALHREAMFDLIAKVFSHRGYFNALDWCRNGYIDHSHYDWSASRVGIVDGQIVTHFGVWNYAMRVGSARLRTGGVGVVATHPSFRGHGLMNQTTLASLDAMRSLGYDMSLLFGIEKFYHRFGYVPAWAESRMHIKPADLASLSVGAGPVRIRKMTLDARADVEALYNQQMASVTGSAVRPTYNRWTRLWPQEACRWVDDTNTTLGYAYIAKLDSVLQCTEAGGPPALAAAALARIASRLGCLEVRFDNQPLNGPLAQLLRRGNMRCDVSYRASGGPMARVIHLPDSLKQLTRELSNRLRHSTLAQWRGILAITDGRDHVQLTLEHSKITRIDQGASRTRHRIVGNDYVAQLILGSAPPAEVAARGNIQLTGDAARLIEVLFPAQHPTMLAWDYF